MQNDKSFRYLDFREMGSYKFYSSDIEMANKMMYIRNLLEFIDKIDGRWLSSIKTHKISAFFKAKKSALEIIKKRY